MTVLVFGIRPSYCMHPLTKRCRSVCVLSAADTPKHDMHDSRVSTQLGSGAIPNAILAMLQQCITHAEISLQPTVYRWATCRTYRATPRLLLLPGPILQEQTPLIRWTKSDTLTNPASSRNPRERSWISYYYSCTALGVPHERYDTPLTFGSIIPTTNGGTSVVGHYCAWTKPYISAYLSLELRPSIHPSIHPSRRAAVFQTWSLYSKSFLRNPPKYPLFRTGMFRFVTVLAAVSTIHLGS